MQEPDAPPGPSFDFAAWRDSGATLQLWTQIVGKLRLALTPWLNHGWHVPLYVSARGLGSVGDRTSAATAARDRVRSRRPPARDPHVRRAPSAASRSRRCRSPPSTGASWPSSRRSASTSRSTCGRTRWRIRSPSPTTRPCTPPTTAAAAHACWRALVQVDRVFRLFRTGSSARRARCISSGAASTWPSRASPAGRRRCIPGGIPGLPDAVTREAYSHEVSSAGFWPGSDAYPQAAFYSYAYPVAARLRRRRSSPTARVWSKEMGEWLLPYESVRSRRRPRRRAAAVPAVDLSRRRRPGALGPGARLRDRRRAPAATGRLRARCADVRAPAARSARSAAAPP